MEPTDITIELLRAIRDEARKTNERIDGLAQRFDVFGERVDALGERFDGLGNRFDGLSERFDTFTRRVSQMEIRLATELVAVTGAVNEVRDVLRGNLALRPRVDDHERRISALEKR